MGIESPQPVVTDQVLKLNFTNEGGVGGTTRLLKNIAGLWLVQECRRVWNQSGENFAWEDLNQLAAAAKPPLQSFVNPDAPEFLAPSDMPEAIRALSAGAPARPCPGKKARCLRCAWRAWP